MRARRRFTPSVDFLGVRIMPSSIAGTSTGTSTTTMVATTSDDTGSPGTDPTGDGSYMTILTPATDDPPPISTVC